MGSESAATQRVTVFSPEAGGFWIGDVLSGIDDACAQKNAQMVVVQTAVGWQASIFERVPFGDLLRIGRSLRVGSVAVTATMNPDELATLARVDGPIVTVAGLHPRAGGPAILIDNAGGAIEAVRHLIEHGHRRIGFVGAFLQHDIGERYRGYLAALEEAGIEPDPDLLYSVHSDLCEGGREAAAAILGAGIPLSAVFVSTDLHAVEVMAGLQLAGVRIPDDVAVVGFDDAEIAQTAVPGLTSIRQIPRALGSAAAATLFDLINGRAAPAGALLQPTALIRRHSCGCFETQHDFLDVLRDWSVDDWQERLRDVLERTLAAPPELIAADGSDEIWPGVDLVIRAFDSAIRGLPASNVAELDEAWRSASVRTRNAETLMGLVDLLEFVGLCRQSGADGDPDAIRPRLRGFLTQARLQVLRYSAIVDPLRHPQGPRVVRDLTRSFMGHGPTEATDLGWLHQVDAARACLALWEPAEGGRALRVCSWYGQAPDDGFMGSLIAPEDFPPADWLGVQDAGGGPGTVAIVPILSPGRDWGILATIVPRDRRYFDGYWTVQQGASMVALALERASNRMDDPWP
jgi:DNA-binding LacI/PurR family transcriptional regulator